MIERKRKFEPGGRVLTAIEVTDAPMKKSEIGE